MPLPRRPGSRHDALPTARGMIGSMLRSLALFTGLVVVTAGCATPGGASASWSYGPSLAPASAGASGAPSAAASVAPSPSATSAASPSATASAGPSASATSGGAALELTIGTKTGTEEEFDPDSEKAPSGARVTITFENLGSVPHNLTFKAPINAATGPAVAPGASDTVEFTAPAPGEYIWMCTIHAGMEGRLEVE